MNPLEITTQFFKQKNPTFTRNECYEVVNYFFCE